MLRMVDLIQHRYGWTDGVVFSLPYSRFLDICDIVVEVSTEENTESYRKAAFTAYLGAGLKDVSYGQYLDALGIGENSNVKDEILSAEDAVAKAHDILAKFQTEK